MTNVFERYDKSFNESSCTLLVPQNFSADKFSSSIPDLRKILQVRKFEVVFDHAIVCAGLLPSILRFFASSF